MIRRISLPADSPAAPAQDVLDVPSDDGVEAVGMRASRRARHWTEAIVEHECVAGRANHRTFDDVFEFPYVARPRIRLKRVHHRLGNPLDLPVQRPLPAMNKKPDQARNVVRTFMERRKTNRIDAQTIEQVGAELASLGERGEAAMRRGNDA